jgi:uncharacterized membrane protein YeaQ/YmgE (transglycosylase-associated protein family)
MWILFGGVTGWVVSYLVRASDKVRTFSLCLEGVTGAVLGGLLFKLLTNDNGNIEVNSLFSAVGGSVLLIVLIHFYRTK